MSKLPSLDDLNYEKVVEAEEEFDETGTLARPYDPRLIRVEPKMFSLRNIMDMIDEGEIDLAPDFQRLRVWSPTQKSRLIESILLRIPLPAFYFAADQEGRLQVVDGVQRLSTIFGFVRKDEFPLVNLEYLHDELGGHRFSTFASSVWAKRINNTQIVANVIDPQTPPAVKFDIFKRINTGGTPLNSQEIRHCMSGHKSRALLHAITSTAEFDEATGGNLAGHVRMADREMVLRVLAFSLLGLDAFLKSDGLDDFLNQTTQFIDKAFSQADMNAVAAHFTVVMQIAHQIFGPYAFRKWPAGEDRRHPINRALFESVGATIYLNSHQLKQPGEIVSVYRELCTGDPEFLASITQSTGSASSVMQRFTKLRGALVR